MTKRLEYTPDPTLGDAPLVLNHNEVFVFGANQIGSHGGGSAAAAVKFYDAIWGEIHRTGRSYGIVTLNFPSGSVEGKPPVNTISRITQDELNKEFKLFIKATELEPEKIFYLTKVGIGIAGWSLNDVMYAFNLSYKPNRHPNIVLPKEFAEYNLLSKKRSRALWNAKRIKDKINLGKEVKVQPSFWEQVAMDYMTQMNKLC
jgi:hypothetical protein